jgi:hypothetical protein
LTTESAWMTRGFSLALAHVSHLRPEGKPSKHRRSDCRKGLHDFGALQNIGAGISRRVCARCSSVTIDLTNSFELAAPVTSTHPTIGSMAARKS